MPTEEKPNVFQSFVDKMTMEEKRLFKKWLDGTWLSPQPAERQRIESRHEQGEGSANLSKETR